MQTDGFLVTESHIRIFAKAVSWRVWGTIISVIVSFMLTHELIIALSVGAIEFFSKIILFYMHERIWDLVNWGMRAKAVSQNELKKYT